MFSYFDTIQACDGHPATQQHSASQPRCRSIYRAYYVAQVTRNSAIADKPARRIYRSVKVTKHSTIPYIRYSFLLCNSNFVFQTRALLTTFDSKNVVTLNGSVKVIGYITIP